MLFARLLETDRPGQRRMLLALGPPFAIGHALLAAGGLVFLATSGKLLLRRSDWAANQVFLALGFFMTAAAVLGVDTCPMEGFEPAKYDELLGLNAQGYASAVLCPAGYRDADDKAATAPKVRYETADVVHYLGS